MKRCIECFKPACCISLGNTKIFVCDKHLLELYKKTYDLLTKPSSEDFKSRFTIKIKGEAINNEKN